jgi:hypothetical protein
MAYCKRIIMKMKHLLTGAFIVSATVVATAQQDTTKSQQPQSRSQQEQQAQPSNQFNAKDYTQLQNSDAPAELRTTLQGNQYKGWENGGKLYRRNNGDGYYLTTGTGNATKSYYFDKSGKAMQSPDGNAKPHRDN